MSSARVTRAQFRARLLAARANRSRLLSTPVVRRTRAERAAFRCLEAYEVDADTPPARPEPRAVEQAAQVAEPQPVFFTYNYEEQVQHLDAHFFPVDPDVVARLAAAFAACAQRAQEVGFGDDSYLPEQPAQLAATQWLPEHLPPSAPIQPHLVDRFIA